MDAANMMQQDIENQEVYDVPIQLCDLPDAVLVHILSRLPMRDAVGTSVLSKMWEYLWTYMPELTFYGDCEFVERALLHRDHRSPMKVFSLYEFDVGRDMQRINNLIYAAVRCPLQELNLFLSRGFGRYVSYALPDCIFKCETLVKFWLQLDEYLFLFVPYTIHFPSLKDLVLEGVRFVGSVSVEMLFSCPMLEELTINRCCWTIVKRVGISAPKLRKLSIEDELFVDHLSKDCQVYIDAANLQDFSYLGELINTYCIVGRPLQLDKAKICIFRLNWSERQTIADRAYELLCNLSSAKILTLTGSFFEYLMEKPNLERALDRLPRFTNMTELEVLIILFGPEWSALMGILRRSPFLQSLKLIVALNNDIYPPEMYSLEEPPDPVPLCFSTQLKKIEVSMPWAVGNADELNEELRMVGILLKHASVLDEMILHCPEIMVKNNDLEQKLKELPRGFGEVYDMLGNLINDDAVAHREYGYVMMFASHMTDLKELLM